MKKIIADFDSVFKVQNFSELPLTEDMELYVFVESNELIPITLVPALQACPAKIEFVSGAVSTKYILIGLLAADANNELWIVEDTPADIKIFLPAKYTSVKSIKDIFKVKKKKTQMEPKVIKSEATKTPAQVKPTPVKTKTKERLNPTTPAREKAPSPAPAKTETPAPRKKNDSVKESATPAKTNDKMDKLLAALKEIDSSYPFEDCINPLATALYNAVEIVSLEIQIRINCGKDKVEKLYPMLSPHFAKLKKIVSE